MTIRSMCLLVASAVLSVGIGSAARGQGFSNTLPSERLGRTGFGTGGVTRYGSAGGEAPSGILAAGIGTSGGMPRMYYARSQAELLALRRNIASLRLRTIESFALARRARFAGLQRMSLELASKLGGGNVVGSMDVHRSFFQFVFPFGLREKSAEYGYGYFCLGCLSRGLIKNPEEFLAEFSEEAQETISNETFMNATASMFSTGSLPEGQQLDQFYDSQLAAMGNYLFSNRRYKAASEVWAVLAARNAQSSVYAQAWGQSLLASRKYEQASDELRRSVKLAAGRDGAAFRITGSNLQSIYADAGDLAEVRMHLGALVKTNAGNAKLEFLMGYIDVFHGLWGPARTRLAGRSAQGDAEAAVLLEALTSGRVEASVRRPFTAEELRGGDVAGVGVEGPLTPEARVKFVKTTRRPSAYEDYMGRGDFYFFMGNYAVASQAYTQAAKLEPDNVIVKFALVHTAFASGEFNYAARRLREALAKEPNWGLFNFRLEEFFGERHDMDKRVRDLEHLIELRPAEVGNKLLLGYVYYFDGRFGEAAKLLGKVARESPDYQAAGQLLKLAQLQS